MNYPAIDFDHLPDGVSPLAREPQFDPAKHLALEKPTEIISLTEFGYPADEVAACPSDFAATDIRTKNFWANDALQAMS